jgi:hypothetical protein
MPIKCGRMCGVPECGLISAQILPMICFEGYGGQGSGIPAFRPSRALATAIRATMTLPCRTLATFQFEQPVGRGASVHDGGHGSAANAGKIRRTMVKVLIVSCSSASRIRTTNFNSRQGMNESYFPSVTPETRAFNVPTPFGAIVLMGDCNV